MIPIAGAGWESYQSKYGYFKPNEAFYPDGKILHTTISVSWGREMKAYIGGTFDGDGNIDTSSVGANVQGGQIMDIYKAAIKIGHELGNHTIDHMESNSPLPYAKEMLIRVMLKVLLSEMVLPSGMENGLTQHY